MTQRWTAADLAKLTKGQPSHADAAILRADAPAGPGRRVADAPVKTPRNGQISLTLPYPPSANAYWRSVVIAGRVRVLLSSEARRYKKAVAKYAASVVRAPMLGPLRLTLTVYRPRRAGDLSNRIKVVEDALNGVCYVDDSQIVEIIARRFDDKANPRAEILIEAVL